MLFNTLSLPLLCAAASIFCSGCASSSYQYGRFKNSSVPCEPVSENVVTYDGRHPILDGMEYLIHTPIEKAEAMISRNPPDCRSRKERMRASLAVTKQYLMMNDLSDVYVDVRRYSPAKQWKRLRQNQEIHPAWKYTLGTIYWCIETVVPARAFRYSYYNPFTKTLAVNSVWREWNIYEAARAKDFLGVPHCGCYIAAQNIPFVPLFQEVQVSNDALSYARAQRDEDLEHELYPFAYGEIFGCTVEEAAFITPGLSGLPYFVSPLIWGGSFATGYSIGTLRSKRE